MGSHVVGSVEQIPEGAGLIVDVDGRSIGVFKVGGTYYALRNRCPHQSGPLCEGRLFPTHKAQVTESGRIREYLDYEQMVLCCPWHGWEFDVATGRCLADGDRRVATYPVSVQDGEIVVEVG